MKGYKWSPEKLKNHRGMSGKSHSINTREAVSKAQKGREHTPQEGFQKGHKAVEGTEKTRFYKGQPSWNKGTGKGTDPIKIKFSVYKSNAKKRGVEFDIEIDKFREYVGGVCYYCDEKAIGIDRLDSKLGYIEGNMVSCCEMCNRMKNSFDLKMFIEKCRKISNKFVQAVGYEV